MSRNARDRKSNKCNSRVKNYIENNSHSNNNENNKSRERQWQIKQITEREKGKGLYQRIKNTENINCRKINENNKSSERCCQI